MIAARGNALLVALMALCGVGGLLALAIGILFFIEQPEIAERRRLVSELPSYRDVRPGEVTFVEGKISQATPLLRAEFVAYRRWQLRGRPGHRTSAWVNLGGENQTLALDTLHGPVWVSNNDYDFDDWTGRDGDVEREDTPARALEGAIDIRGFVRGSAVLAFGQLEASEPQVTFRATSLAPGTRESYLEELHARSGRNTEAAWALLVTAIPLLAVAIWLGRRAWRLPIE